MVRTQRDAGQTYDEDRSILLDTQLPKEPLFKEELDFMNNLESLKSSG